jgi:hypothetical protein
MMDNRRFSENMSHDLGYYVLNLAWRNPAFRARQRIEEDEIDDLCTYLRTVPYLNRLNLGGHLFSEANLMKVISITTVKELQINAYNLGEAGWKALANNPHLKVINLNYSQLTEEKLIHLLNVLKKTNPLSVQRLELAGNELTDKGALAIAQFCKLYPEVFINLSENHIGELGARALLSVTDKVDLMSQYSVDKEGNPRDIITSLQWNMLKAPCEKPYEQWVRERNANLHPNCPSLENFSFYAAKNVVKKWIEPEKALAELPEHLKKFPRNLENELIESVKTEICRPK